MRKSTIRLFLGTYIRVIFVTLGNILSKIPLKARNSDLPPNLHLHLTSSPKKNHLFSPEINYKGLNKIHPDNTRNSSLGVCWFIAPRGIADVVSGSKKGPGGVGCQSFVFCCCFFFLLIPNYRLCYESEAQLKQSASAGVCEVSITLGRGVKSRAGTELPC